MNLMLRLLLGACSVIAWLNISNDAWDYQTGVDSGNRKPESIVNLLNGDVESSAHDPAAFLFAGVVTIRLFCERASRGANCVVVGDWLRVRVSSAAVKVVI